MTTTLDAPTNDTPTHHFDESIAFTPPSAPHMRSSSGFACQGNGSPSPQPSQPNSSPDKSSGWRSDMSDEDKQKMTERLRDRYGIRSPIEEDDDE